MKVPCWSSLTACSSWSRVFIPMGPFPDRTHQVVPPEALRVLTGPAPLRGLASTTLRALLSPSIRPSARRDHSQGTPDHFQAAHAHSQTTQLRSSLTSRPLPNHSTSLPKHPESVPSRSRSTPNRSTPVPLPTPDSSKQPDLGPPGPHGLFQTIFGYSQVTQPHLPCPARSLPNHCR